MKMYVYGPYMSQWFIISQLPIKR